MNVAELENKVKNLSVFGIELFNDQGNKRISNTVKHPGQGDEDTDQCRSNGKTEVSDIGSIT